MRNISRPNRIYTETSYLICSNCYKPDQAKIIGVDRTRNYHADSEGVELNFSVMSEAVTTFRKSSAMPDDWNDKIQRFKRTTNGAEVRNNVR